MKHDPGPKPSPEYTKWTRLIFGCGTPKQLAAVESRVELETDGELRAKLRKLVSARRQMLADPR